MKFEDDGISSILNVFNSIFKEHELNSQYFLDWIMINYHPTDIAWECVKTPSEKEEYKSQFSVLTNGLWNTIGKFIIKENKIIYHLQNQYIFENVFLNNMIESGLSNNCSNNMEDLLINYEHSFFGPIRLRAARTQSCIIARFFVTQRSTFEPTINYFIDPLENILAYLETNKDFIVDDEQKEVIRNTYYSILKEEIDFNNLDYSLKLIDEYKNVLKIINY